ncbi:MAG: hypothetical protein WCW84_06840 [Sulfurimonas sp.]|jgi:hypothetical protein
MGFKEIAMIVVGLILAGILALAIAPSISASGDSTKASVLNSELESVASAGKMWMVNNTTSGTFTGINAVAMANNLPNLVATGTGATSIFTSKVVGAITYTVVAATSGSTDDSMKITMTGLTGGSAIETSIKNALIAKYLTGNVVNTTPGTIVVTIRG